MTVCWTQSGRSAVNRRNEMMLEAKSPNYNERKEETDTVARSIMIQGTMSNAGKSVLAGGPVSYTHLTLPTIA